MGVRDGPMRILVIQQKMIGDVLTSSILFEALRNKYPDAELHYLIQPHTLAVVENNPFIDRIVLFDPEKYKGFSGLINFAHEVRAGSYDIVVDVYAKINSAIITAISGAKTRISYNKWYTSSAYTKTFQLSKEAKTNAGVAIENRMLLLQGIDRGFPVEIKPKIFLTNVEKLEAKQKLLDAAIDPEKPLFMISILGSSPEKSYPGDYMAKVLDLLVESCDSQLLFNYNPKQKWEAMEIVEKCKPETRSNSRVDIFGTNLREFLALTSHCDALIGNEGGAVNMAKALNIPTFSIFSPQIEKNVWAVYPDELNVAVHVDDFIIKEDRNYKNFKPEYFLPQLKVFLEKVRGK